MSNILITNNKRTLTVSLAKQGTTGQGVPSGGSTGQFLQKVDNSDFNTFWTDSSSTVAWGTILGTLSDQTDLQIVLNSKEDSFTKNTAFNKDFGTTTNTLIHGNDSRLSDARTPLVHTHTESDITDLQSYLLNITSEQIEDLSNVAITAITSNEILKWNGTAWINQTLAESNISEIGHSHIITDVTGLQTTLDNKADSVHTHVMVDITDSTWISDITGSPLSQLSDVTLTTIASNEILKWNGTAWINQTLTEAGIAALVHTHIKADITDFSDGDYATSAQGITADSALQDITAEKLVNLQDIPSIVGQSGKLLKVNPTANGYVWENATAGTMTWGSILGTLSDQTDLQTSLDNKVDNSQVLTNVPVGAEFTDTVYDDTTINAAINSKEDSFTKNTAFNLNFGTTTNTLIHGNDSRLSDARTPLSHTHLEADITDLQPYLLNINSEVINDLSDVVITTPSANQVLSYDGTNWINSSISVSGGTNAIKNPVTVATTSPLPSYTKLGNTITFDNYGDLTIDDKLFNAGARVLVKDEVDQSINGIYQFGLSSVTGSPEVSEILVNQSPHNESEWYDKWIGISSPTQDYYVWFRHGGQPGNDPTPPGRILLGSDTSSSSFGVMTWNIRDAINQGTAISGISATANSITGIVTITNGVDGTSNDTISGNSPSIATTISQGANGQYPTIIRTSDYDSSNEIIPGSLIAVEEGTVNADDIFILTTDGTINLDTSLLNYTSIKSSLVDSVNGQTGTVVLSTTNITEGTNEYYTEAKVSANSDVAANTSHGILINNPHSVTATQLNLGNVDDTSDLNKPVSTSTQTALDLKEDSFTKNTAFNLNFGTTNGTLIHGNDSRLSDARTPLAHTHLEADITDLQPYLLDISGSALSELSDVTITGNTVNEVLKWSGTAWINNTIAELNVSTTDVSEGTNLYYTEGRVSANIDVANSVTHAVDSTIHFTQASISITESQISDLGTYETAFTKNTAFNLNFGTTNGTLIHGNDSRLSDARTPTTHTHIISDITSLQIELDLKEDEFVIINNQVGTTYTLLLTDASKYVRMNNASASTLTVPLNSSVAYLIGTQIDIRQVGSGQVTIVATAGVTINTNETLLINKQHSACAIVKVATNEWDLIGDMELA